MHNAVAAARPADVIGSKADDGSLRMRLRRATQAEHRALDSLIAPAMFASEQNYRRYLRAMYAAFAPLEQAFESANVARILPDWHGRRRTAALASDLAAFGDNPPPSCPSLAMPGEAALMGALYVTEGSRLGAAYLTRRACAEGGGRIQGAMQFLRHGEGMDFWSTFVATLERSQAALEDFDSAVASARRVFELFRECCLAAAAH